MAGMQHGSWSIVPDIFPLAHFPFVYASRDQEELWQKIGWEKSIEMLISWGCNTVMSVANPEIVAETLKKIPFVEGIEKQTVSIAACAGHWARGLPIARGKGVNFDTLMEIDLKHVDPLSLNLETAVRVRVRKVD